MTADSDNLEDLIEWGIPVHVYCLKYLLPREDVTCLKYNFFVHQPPDVAKQHFVEWWGALTPNSFVSAFSDVVIPAWEPQYDYSFFYMRWKKVGEPGLLKTAELRWTASGGGEFLRMDSINNILDERGIQQPPQMRAKQIE